MTYAPSILFGAKLAFARAVNRPCEQKYEVVCEGEDDRPRKMKRPAVYIVQDKSSYRLAFSHYRRISYLRW